MAQTVSSTQEVLETLQAEGYQEIETRRTLLGKLRITAQSATSSREVVINPRTGEVLRDYTEESDADAPSPPERFGGMDDRPGADDRGNQTFDRPDLSDRADGERPDRPEFEGDRPEPPESDGNRPDRDFDPAGRGD